MISALNELRKHAKRLADARIDALFGGSGRFKNYSASGAGILLDYSKTLIDDAVRSDLLYLAELRGVEALRDAMFRGCKVNITEKRAVLHVALRADDAATLPLEGEDIMPMVRAGRERMFEFAEGVRSGAINGVGGAFTDVVNIGIGGSDLGPETVVHALEPYCDGPRVHFVSNADGASVGDVLKHLDPSRTLVLVVSKSFGTVETAINADTARAWLVDALGEQAVGDHFAAISVNKPAVAAFGIRPDRRFDMWDWVGGRYSVWGAVGMSVALAIGAARFNEFLAGARAMDDHFREAAPQQNLPILMGLVGVWHRTILGYPTRAVAPYDHRLSRFPSYLQQLDMESNGKSVRADGTRIVGATGPIVWGATGTNSQHAFFQLLHQGTDVIPVEFLIAGRGHEPGLDSHHKVLMANCLAQSRALMCGRSGDEARAEMLAAGSGEAEADRLAPHRHFEGNRPSVTLVYEKLTPGTLGSLIALYEHRVLVEGALWGINSFDQWGVELGKALAEELSGAFDDPAVLPEGGDCSTSGLAAALNAHRGKG